MLATQAARSLRLLFCGAALVSGSESLANCESPELMRRADIVGLGMAEVRGGQIDVSHHGYARSPDDCVTPATVFEAASLTKPVIAYLVMRLVDQGRLDLDDALLDLLPPLPLPEDDPRSGQVTVRMALAHSSGLDGPDDGELRFLSDPGETFRYYPAGYRLVQRIVESLEGEPLEAIARREVFEPLGMSSSSLVFREDLLERIATRHRMLGDTVERDRDPAWPANAAASLITTPRDYGVFLREMLGGDGLSPSARAAMLTANVVVPETDGAVAWGIGWGLEPERGTFFHYGDDGAAKSFVIGSLEAEQAIVYFANSYYGMAIAGEIAARLVPGESPAVEWLGYASWDSPMRLARRDTLRAFVEGDADLGMETFHKYDRDYPDLDMNNAAAFLSWVLESRGLHEGRTRLVAWQIEEEPENVTHYRNLAQSHRALGDLQSAMDALRQARTVADEANALQIDVQLDWMRDEALAAQRVGGVPAYGASQIQGRYETWRVFREDDRLAFQPGEGRTYTLRWMHGTTYALEEVEWFRLRFVIEDGRASRVIGRYSDGRTDESTRTGDGDER